MKEKVIFLLVILFTLSAAISCNLPSTQSTPTPSPSETPVVVLNTATIETAISETPPFIAITTTFIAGDLGWGAIRGEVTDTITGAPIVGATVTCWHYSYISPARCDSSIVTDKDGAYIFTDIYFHDTDHIQMKVEFPGYVTQTIDIRSIITPWLTADFALVPDLNTASPQIACTQPACGPYEALACPAGNCPNGCGYVCITPAAICTPPVCAIGTSEVYYCESGVCAGGCGTTCATFTPAP